MLNRRRGMPEIKEGNINVTPLIDVVMCLIIFFMLVAHIGVATGVDKEIHVPPSFLGVDLKDMGNTFTLNVSNGPDIRGSAPEPTITALVKGSLQELKVNSNLGGQESHPLYETLKYFHEGDPKRGIPANPDFKVIIRADEGMEYQFLQPVLAACSSAGVTYEFATGKGEAAPQ